MQSDNKELYKITAARTGKSEQIYKDIGNTVFASLSSSLRRPKSLIIRLKGIGYWYIRRRRMEEVMSYASEEKMDDPLRNEDKVEVQRLFRERLKDYEEYIKIRNETRQERQKPSQDNPS